MCKPRKECISQYLKEDFDETKILNDLLSAPWDIIKLFDDIDDILEAWLDFFCKL